MISVCIPTYNGEKYILKQLRSILEQLNINDEVIISDDSSTDNTIRIIESLNDPRIKIFTNSSTKGLIGNIENAISKANGDYIFLSDQDDIWSPNKVEKVCSFFNSKDLILTNYRFIDENDQFIDDFQYSRKKYPRNFLSNLYQNPYRGCCIAFNKKLKAAILPFPRKIPMHDIWIGLLAQLYGTTYFIDEELVYYRRHSENASPIGISKYSLMFKIKSRIYVFASLMFRLIKLKLKQ